MKVISAGFIFVVVFLLASQAQAQEDDARSAPLVDQNISQKCFGCMYEAGSRCNTTTGCSGNVCGPFCITWAYWADGGKPTLNNEANTAEGAWSRCAIDPFCASKAVQGYMNKFAQDCTGDGVINCDDYVRIHRFGGYGCNKPLDPEWESAYSACTAIYGNA